jgi:hypothetical protein
MESVDSNRLGVYGTCPTCSAPFVSTAESTTEEYTSSFVDGLGRVHEHDGNEGDATLTCSNGHDKAFSYIATCWCGWNSRDGGGDCPEPHAYSDDEDSDEDSDEGEQDEGD